MSAVDWLGETFIGIIIGLSLLIGPVIIHVKADQLLKELRHKQTCLDYKQSLNDFIYADLPQTEEASMLALKLLAVPCPEFVDVNK